MMPFLSEEVLAPPTLNAAPPARREARDGPKKYNALRVLFLADAYFDDLPGGSRVVARQLAHGLAGRGHQVIFLVGRQNPDAPDDCLQDGIRVIRYPGAGSHLAFMAQGRRACARLLAEQSFDIVHTHFAYAALGPLQALPRSVARVRTFHGPWDEEGWLEDMSHAPGPARRLKALVKRWLRRRVEARNLGGSRAILTLSDCFSAKVIGGHHIPAERVHKIPGGTDVCRFVPAPDKARTRMTLGLPQGRRILLSVRRLTSRMGLDNLIRAMPAVAARHPEALLLIGGQGPERERLQGLICRSGMEDHVRLIGYVPDARLAAYYQAADLFVLPTLALEGFGLVTTEALACGLPVVGTDAGATPEILNALDARLVARGTGPEALAEAILGFLEGDWAAGLTPERLHRFVCEGYRWEWHTDAVEALYAALTGHAAHL